MRWEGAVCKVGMVSDGIPGGSDAPIILERDAIEAAIQTMVGMPLNCEWPEDWWSNPALALTGHNGRFVIGSVQKAWIDGDYVMCSGIIWKDNFPDVAFMLQNAKEALGFSIEMYPLESKLEKDENRHVYKLEFVGLCVCWSNLAAFNDTFITKLAATIKDKKETDKVEFTKEQLQEMLDTMVKQITAANKEATDKLEAQITELQGKLEAANTEVESLKGQLASKEEEIQAAKVTASAVPAPNATQTPAKKDEVNPYEDLSKINAMNVSPEEKAKLRFALYLKQDVKQA